jgi:hypothetical protein
LKRRSIEEETMLGMFKRRSPRIGHLDGYSHGKLHGWAAEKSTSARLSVDVYLGGKKLATVPCQEFRPDLKKAGFGDGCHGFQYSLPLESHDCKGIHSVTVCFAGTKRKLINGTMRLVSTAESILKPAEMGRNLDFRDKFLPPIFQPTQLYPEDARDLEEHPALYGRCVEAVRGQYRSRTSRKTAPLTVATLVFKAPTFTEHLSRSLEYADVEVELIVEHNPDNHTAQARFYNRVIDTARNDRILFCHPDIEFSPWALSSLLETAAGLPGWGAVGVVGATLQGLFAWSDRRRNPREVSTLDSILVLIDRRHGLRFDEANFDTFHCVVEDYCLQGQRLGLKTYVAPGITISHFDSTYAKTAAFVEPWVAEYRHYHARLEKKYPGTPFCTTGGPDSQSQQLRHAFQQLTAELEAAEAELLALRTSPSLRVGRLLTSPGRLLRRLARQP